MLGEGWTRFYRYAPVGGTLWLLVSKRGPGGESAPESFLKSAPYVIHVHFKDFAIVPEGAMQCLDGKFRLGVLVGDGTVDQVGTLRAMKEHGYAGYINFEYEGREYAPREATIEGVRRMRQWIASLD